ncbi:MAG: hypothetical protein SFU98_00990 [Leptospiraceae bacterium]|nr:hypothetical protein [Leptospiraceae bacterium]
MKELLLKKYNEAKTFLMTDIGKSFIALLPLFFTWQPVLIYNLDNELVKKNSIRGFLFTLYFFCSLVISFIVSYLPLIGQILAGIIHILGVGIYLALSGFFIYCLLKNKNMELEMIAKHEQKLNSLLF